MRLNFGFAALPLLVAMVSPALAQSSCTRLDGVVMDSTGALIPGANVTLDGKTEHRSDAAGRFDFACLSEGKHALTASAEGFAGYTVRFSAPHEAELRLRMVPSTEASVTVNAEDSDMQVAPPGASNGLVVAGRQLQALADDPDDLLRQLQQLGAMAGGNPSKTTVSVDGFQDDAKLPPKDSIAFINVSPDLFSAEYREPPFGGGRVEVYTKPGAKAYHGALYTTNSSSWMNAADPFAPSTGKLGKQRYGFDLSGPIQKKGSNFSLSLEHRQIDSLAVVNAITFDNTGKQQATIYNAPTPQSLWEGQARVDWQLGPKNIFFVSYSSNVNSQQNNGVGGTVLQEAGYNVGTNDQTVRFSDVTMFSPMLMHEARVAIEWYRETDVANSTAPSVQVSGYFTGGGVSTGNSQQFRTRVEYDDDFVLTTKQHTLKAGYQVFWLHRNSNVPTNFNGNYTFGTAAEYAAKTPEVFNNVSGNPNIEFHQVRFVGFAQDNMKLKPNLTFAMGVRYFLESSPATYKNFQPRIGLVWSPDAKKKWNVTSHFGIFQGQYSADEVQELQRLDGVQRVSSLIYNPVYGAPFSGATPITTKRTFAPGTGPGTFMMGELGVSRDLGKGFNLNVEEIQARFLNYVRTLNINQPLDSNPYGARPYGANQNILQVQNSGTGIGHGEVVVLSNFSHKVAGGVVGFVHLNIRDTTNDDTFFQPESSTSDAGEEVRRVGQGSWQIFSNVNVNLPWKLSLSYNGFMQGGSPYNLLTGSDNNGDGNFNDRPQYAAPGAVANGTTNFETPFGLLTNDGDYVNGTPVRPTERNMGKLPWNFHLDANLQRAFVLNRDKKAVHQQTVTLNVRSANFLNHTNVTSEGSVLGTPQFLAPVAADTGRRIEFGAKYSF
ncbi:MAG: carboxypeptidase regulatory-like domain-containing protein [Acidobacteriaceae bacterium]|nr:carboxypeptidase regulatory-like domain-containing protein [Acidobacteriaceae bacterium]